MRIRKWLSWTALAIVMAAVLVGCGKDKPGTPAPGAAGGGTNPPVVTPVVPVEQARAHFTSLATRFIAGAGAAAGGRAFYLTSPVQNITAPNNPRAKVNLFLFTAPASTFVLEYWEVTNNRLRGALYHGTWSVSATGQLVLTELAQNIANGTVLNPAGGPPSISLTFGNGFTPTVRTPDLNGGGRTLTWVLSHPRPNPSTRVLPANVQTGLIGAMNAVNGRNDRTFLD